MSLKSLGQKVLNAVTGEKSEAQVVLDSMAAEQRRVAEEAEAARVGDLDLKLTKHQKRLVSRFPIRSAGGQKILNLLARGTRVDNSPAANMVLGQAYNLY